MEKMSLRLFLSYGGFKKTGSHTVFLMGMFNKKAAREYLF